MSTARLLILGVLRKIQPIHGYDVRRELEEWGAEEWSNLAYGSIYFALNKMAEEGLLETSGGEVVGKRPARTQYTMTEKGEREYFRLLREYWWKVEALKDPFQVAMSFMDTLPQNELLEALRFRADTMRATMRSLEVGIANNKFAEDIPRHAVENLRLSYLRGQAQIQWLEEVIGKVERGELP